MHWWLWYLGCVLCHGGRSSLKMKRVLLSGDSALVLMWCYAGDKRTSHLGCLLCRLTWFAWILHCNKFMMMQKKLTDEIMCIGIKWHSPRWLLLFSLTRKNGISLTSILMVGFFELGAHNLIDHNSPCGGKWPKMICHWLGNPCGGRKGCLQCVLFLVS